ncbi:VOC family protein [Capillimicrobium parvum]|uniref:VOC domain-containing protein n=1 Tax=Capillimicrobium parvum TaxID=2884022 RepID=A0A9E6XWC4_9ACTN|nr:VOC family protein [Capillimicrobium parvum]UGS35659.1 hypothetical protein DSM104329_02054 [Capillimicrobium parvum]
MFPTFDHTAIITADMQESVRFYCEGLGLKMVSDEEIVGNMQRIFGVESDSVHAIQLAHPEDVNVALVELVEFRDGVNRRDEPPRGLPARGLWLIAFRCDFDATVEKLAALGYPAIVDAFDGEVSEGDAYDPSIKLRVGVVAGPDGEVVELVPKELSLASVRLRQRGAVGSVE